MRSSDYACTRWKSRLGVWKKRRGKERHHRALNLEEVRQASNKTYHSTVRLKSLTLFQTETNEWASDIPLHFCRRTNSCLLSERNNMRNLKGSASHQRARVQGFLKSFVGSWTSYRGVSNKQRAFLLRTVLTNEPSKWPANELCLLFFRSDAARKRYRLSVVVVNSHLPLTGGRRRAHRTRLFCSSIVGNCRLAVAY